MCDPNSTHNANKHQPTGSLEYHFPGATGTSESCQAVSYSHVAYDITAAEHPTACDIPESGHGRPSIVVDPDRLEDLFRPEGAPTSIGDYLNSDIPQIGLHIVSFLDKTLVTVYFPHTLMDGMSMVPFFDAWIMALQGHGSEIKRPIGAEEYAHGVSNYPLAEFGTEPAVKHVLSTRQMSIAGLVGWMLRNVSSFFTTVENRMVCVPASTIATLHAEALLDSAVERAGDEPAPFLSDGDLLCAWWTRLLLATAGVVQNPHQAVVINSAYSLRKLLLDPDTDHETKPVPGSGNVYVSNLVAFFNVILTAGDVLRQPLYRTALASEKLPHSFSTFPSNIRDPPMVFPPKGPLRYHKF